MSTPPFLLPQVLGAQTLVKAEILNQKCLLEISAAIDAHEKIYYNNRRG
jgi:hypothetical protein